MSSPQKNAGYWEYYFKIVLKYFLLKNSFYYLFSLEEYKFEMKYQKIHLFSNKKHYLYYNGILLI